ncbi:MAG: CDP-alcohol phosphatidyltransferase family protein [Hyphomicrobiaceae bacterium]|nr:CDP-alcohol phosphatidyltransferase family protein [Hyphomicrobiaceae bacterium]
MNLPNFITLGRVISVPIVFWLLLSGQSKAAFFIFVAAGISDAVDGYLAKRFNSQTELGAYLDPMADKLLIVSIYIALGARNEIPLWLVVAVVSRDVLIVLAILLSWLMDHPVVIKPFIISKLNTASQLVLASFVLADDAFGLGYMQTRQVLVFITGLLTFLSTAAYLRAWLRHMTGPIESTKLD